MYLDWSEVKAMQSHGIGFGSHSVTHPILSSFIRNRGTGRDLGIKKLDGKMLGFE